MRAAQSVPRRNVPRETFDKILRVTHIIEMRIKEYRKQQKLTQVQMAERWQTDAGNLSRVERGVQRPSIELAERIAADTGLTLDEIFSESRDLHAA